MKVVHLSTHDVSGGAGRAATRLHRQLRVNGHDSSMLVAEKTGHDTHTTSLHTSFGYSLRRNLNRLPLNLVDLNAIVMPNVAWLPNPALAEVARRRPDIVHLHWAQNGFVPLAWLKTLKTPLVWTFHDMWPFCGVLHNEFEETQRFHEPYTTANRPAGRRGFDIDALVWRQKQRLYRDLDAAAIAPSHWLADKARNSELWRDRRIEVIPNGLDTRVFKPGDRAAARHFFNLPQDRVVILFGAMYARDDINKGYDKLREALERLSLPKDQVHLAIFGMDAPENPEPLPYSVSHLGVLRDEVSMAALYNAADVMVVPSLQESFGQTASEPMACGRPVVAFETSGLVDVIDHQVNGYLAQPFDPADLANGIEWVLGNRDRRNALGLAARRKALESFDARVVAERHESLYREMLENRARVRSMNRHGPSFIAPPREEAVRRS